MSDLRQRSRRSTSTRMKGEETDPFIVPGKGLSASSLIDSRPQMHGAVKKLHTPLFFSILPAFIQRIILSWSCLSPFAPSWKVRYIPFFFRILFFESSHYFLLELFKQGALFNPLWFVPVQIQRHILRHTKGLSI